MPKAGRETAPDPLAVGWNQLAEGDWDGARASFEAAVADEESPEALEGLSWAAWWLDDAEAVFDARERAYRLYRKSGDPAGAARMATWLAIDHLDFSGALAVTSAWLQRAHRLLDPLESGPEHGWLDFQEGYIARLRGDTDRAEQLAARAAEIGRRFEVPDLEMLGLALQGATLVGRTEIADGMRCLDEATLLALEGEAHIPISGAWACCFLVTACSAARDYERAFEWCDRIAEFAERYGSRYMLAFCRAEYGEIHLWRGDWKQAEALLDAAVEDFTRSRPAMAGAPLAGLAELRRRQGRHAEAETLLDRAGTSTKALLCQARIALDRGKAGRAAELCERVLRQLPEHLKLDRTPALELLVRACVGRGDLDRATTALTDLREVERLVDSAPLRAHADVAAASLAAASGDYERARSLLEDAADRFQRSGAPYEAAEARIELATTLLALARTDDAQRDAAGALETLLDLGAKLGAERARWLLRGDARRNEPSRLSVTPREREVLGLLAEGLTNRQIAERLVVSEHTVHRHVTNILRKLDLPSRTAAAAYAVRSGLLEDPAHSQDGQ
jgi:LuxR family transcriptional regulator, maltose regulon positive regulatory protein